MVATVFCRIHRSSIVNLDCVQGLRLSEEENTRSCSTTASAYASVAATARGSNPALALSARSLAERSSRARKRSDLRSIPGILTATPYAAHVDCLIICFRVMRSPEVALTQWPRRSLPG